MYDLILRGGLVCDGSGGPPAPADVAVAGGRIAALGDLGGAAARQELPAAGLVVAPGFIDPHTHDELLAFAAGAVDDYLRQGVTTAIAGTGRQHPGLTSAGVLAGMYEVGAGRESLPGEFRFQWPDFAAYRRAVESLGGAPVNLGLLLDYAGVCMSLLGPGEGRGLAARARLAAFVDHALTQGALGVTLAIPGGPVPIAADPELVEMGRVVAARGRLLSCHLPPGPAATEAARQALDLGRLIGVRLQLSHVDMQEPGVCYLVEQYRRAGVDAAVDIVPASRGHLVTREHLVRHLLALFPGWEDSLYELRHVLSTPGGRRRAAAQQHLLLGLPPERVRLVNCPDRRLAGRTLADVAAERGSHPVDLLLDLLLGDTPVAFWFTRRGRPGWEPPPPAMLACPFVGPGGNSLEVVEGPGGEAVAVRSRAAFSVFFQQARRSGLNVAEAVRRATDLPARRFGLADRGRLQPGLAADVVAFDPRPGCAVRHLLVAGQPVLLDGEATGARPGLVLPAPAAAREKEKGR